MQVGKFFGAAFGLLLAIAAFRPGAPTSSTQADAQTLAVREEPDRIVLAWRGPVKKPMREQFVAAMARFGADPRRIVLTLNSPGGSVEHGREVMAAIRDAAQAREIDTLVPGAVCASMCLPIYLTGKQRSAGPTAYFMFHEVSLDLPPGKGADRDEPLLSPAVQKIIVKRATDDLFDNDYRARRVNAQWLDGLRSKIVGAEVWKSARQLVDEGSGVVDALVETAPE
jgi:hypothetical protein